MYAPLGGLCGVEGPCDHNSTHWCGGAGDDTDVGGDLGAGQGVPGPRQLQVPHTCAVTCSVWVPESQSGRPGSFSPTPICCVTMALSCLLSGHQFPLLSKDGLN